MASQNTVVPHVGAYIQEGVARLYRPEDKICNFPLIMAKEINLALYVVSEID
jgi:hypothetical protein